MGFVLIQHIADHTFVDQNRFRSGRRREDQLSARVGFPFRHGGADTSGVIGEGTSRSLVVHDSGQGDTPADNGSESMDSAGVFRERDPDQRLLCRISEAERFLFCDHIQVVSGIFPAHAPHFMFIQPGDQGAVFIIVTAVIQLII